MFAIVSSLPLLLQVALLLFFIGLGLFLHQQDHVVAWITTGVMVSWFLVFIFTITVPMFRSQCPYKIPLLRTPSRWVRFKWILHLHNLFVRLWGCATSGTRPKIILRNIRNWLGAIAKRLSTLEEEVVSKDDILDLPVILYARDVLRGECLDDSIIESFRETIDNDTGDIPKAISDQSQAMNRGMLPGGPYGPAKIIGSFALEAAQDDHLRALYFDSQHHSSFFATLYFGMTHLQSQAFVSNSFLIPPHSIAAFVRLTQTNNSLAALSLLTMYSIRHRTLTDHPNIFKILCALDEFDGIGKPTIPLRSLL